eukprot:CAMPEP_0178995220 /NCGR_PEP_ID=MMETSP0795-20121207/7718_1 /TAXON_ID=88552 /ORGANISM="Amoebophrya sp., Strain Ameob2" /LENGTH=375 /DNA_ID=CAMNT_0020687527 /DNA_START=172 /DNA_END=1300 /DNA_ORIENTATION=-
MADELFSRVSALDRELARTGAQLKHFKRQNRSFYVPESGHAGMIEDERPVGEVPADGGAQKASTTPSTAARRGVLKRHIRSVLCHPAFEPVVLCLIALDLFAVFSAEQMHATFSFPSEDSFAHDMWDPKGLTLRHAHKIQQQAGSASPRQLEGGAQLEDSTTPEAPVVALRIFASAAFRWRYYVGLLSKAILTFFLAELALRTYAESSVRAYYFDRELHSGFSLLGHWIDLVVVPVSWAIEFELVFGEQETAGSAGGAGLEPALRTAAVALVRIFAGFYHGVALLGSAHEKVAELEAETREMKGRMLLLETTAGAGAPDQKAMSQDQACPDEEDEDDETLEGEERKEQDKHLRARLSTSVDDRQQLDSEEEDAHH